MTNFPRASLLRLRSKAHFHYPRAEIDLHSDRFLDFLKAICVSQTVTEFAPISFVSHTWMPILAVIFREFGFEERRNTLC